MAEAPSTTATMAAMSGTATATATSGTNFLSRFAVKEKTMPICLNRPKKPTFSGSCALAMRRV